MKRMMMNYRLWLLALLGAAAFLFCFAEYEGLLLTLCVKAVGAALWWLTYILARFWDANRKLEEWNEWSQY